MSNLSHRIAAGLAIALFSVACNGSYDSGASTIAVKPGNGPHKNGDLYKNDGKQPAWGRGETSTLTALALGSRDGGVDVQVTANGPIRSLSITVRSPDGKRLAAYEFGPLPASTVVHLPAGDRGDVLQLMALVDPPGKRKTDPVKAEVVIIFSPDLQVLSFSMAGQAVIGRPVDLEAVVREANGDVGATADCVLRDGTNEIDRANGVWVDAGGTVTCAFRPVFMTLGWRNLTVSVENVSPTDWDPSNQTAELAIKVIPEPIPYVASIESLRTVTMTHQTVATTFSDGSTFFRDATTMVDSTNQSASLSASLTSGTFSFPIPELAFTETSDGTVVRALEFEDVAVSSDQEWNDGVTSFHQVCGAPLDDGTVLVCNETVTDLASGESTHSSYITYVRYAGDVTYHSEGFERFEGADGTGTTYTFNNTQTNAFGDLFPVGSTYEIEAAAWIGGGRVVGADAVMDLVDASSSTSSSGCSDRNARGSFTRTCTDSTTDVTGSVGSASWQP